MVLVLLIWANAFISQNVYMFLCLFVCLSLCLTVFLPPLLKVQCPKFLDIKNCLGKVMERSGIRLEKYAHKGCKIATANKLLNGFFFISSLRLNVFLSPLPEVQCPTFLDIQNALAKVMGRSGLRL